MVALLFPLLGLLSAVQSACSSNNDNFATEGDGNKGTGSGGYGYDGYGYAD